MNRKRKLLWLPLFAALLIAVVLWRTNQYPNGYYGNPLDIPVELAANFGEVRIDHFHMGLDIRTNGRENLPVYAAADGHISRVTIEETGFGHAVYVTHPNGDMTVYAHLNRFIPGLENYVRTKQYGEERWEQDINFTAAELPVKKGELIAYSGNTGTTEGPHLHFEIRDTHTGANLNPLLNGFRLKDNMAPVINGLYWYNRTASIYTDDPTRIDMMSDGNSYAAAGNVISINAPRISFGIEATDKNADTKYKLGIYKAMVFMDGALVFCFALNHFCNTDMRYVNACIDYGKWFEQSKCIQLLCKLPGNRLPVFEGSPGDGVLDLEDRKIHTIKIAVCDAAGNTSTILFNIQYDGDNEKMLHHTKRVELLLPGKSGAVKTANAEADFSDRAFYDTVPFTMYEEQAKEINAASPLIHLGNIPVPVHDNYGIKIRTTLPLGSPLKDHIVMQLTNDKHRYIVKGKWQGNVMQGCFEELGNVQLVIDTVAPDLSCREGDNNRFAANDKALHIQYQDNTSDAAFFRAELDGHWILFEKKGGLFTYYFDEHCPVGKHSLTVTVKDVAGNIRVRKFVFWKE